MGQIIERLELDLVRHDAQAHPYNSRRQHDLDRNYKQEQDRRKLRKTPQDKGMNYDVSNEQQGEKGPQFG